MIGVVFIGGIALKIYAVQQLFQAKLDFIENAIDAKQALITPNLERLIEAKLGIKVRPESRFGLCPLGPGLGFLRFGMFLHPVLALVLAQPPREL